MPEFMDSGFPWNDSYPRNFATTLCSCIAFDMSPSILSLPVMKAVIPSSSPAAIFCQSSQLVLIVVSAAPSLSLTF